jgi:hypothetical protein
MTVGPDLAFARDYEVELMHELPSSSGVEHTFYYPGGAEVGGRDGVIVRVTPHGGTSWLGIFAFGDGPFLTRVLSTPCRRTLCVVARGVGYIVRVDDPHKWEEVPCTPVVDARPIPESDRLIFANFTEILAYGPDGLIWETPRLSHDGLNILKVTAERIEGLVWDAPNQRHVGFSVDVRTGRHHGGAYADD